MNTAQTHETKPTFIERLSHFLSRHRIALTVLIIVIAVAVVALFVVMQVTTNRTEQSLILVEDLQSQYGDWLGLDMDERTAEFDTLVGAITELTQKYPRTYATQRAIYIHARALTELERWTEAADQYLDLVDRFPDVYLAPVSLTQAAVATENANDPQAALDILKRLVDEYDPKSAEIPRALFSIGRINEGLDNIADAAASYNQLIDDYPSSSWTNLARDRIITLSVQGRIGS
jgi:tetratricopeptide (TPR) repeat protein